LSLAGCWGKGGSYKIVEVSGVVKLDGKPLPNAEVTFVPKSDAPPDEHPPPSIGLTDEEGRYTLALTKDTSVKGAAVGKHEVMIRIVAGGSKETKATFHKQLPQRYYRKTELECDVPAEGRDDANFDLKSN
jgi:hypothetical protein